MHHDTNMLVELKRSDMKACLRLNAAAEAEDAELFSALYARVPGIIKETVTNRVATMLLSSGLLDAFRPGVPGLEPPERVSLLEVIQGGKSRGCFEYALFHSDPDPPVSLTETVSTFIARIRAESKEVERRADIAELELGPYTKAFLYYTLQEDTCPKIRALAARCLDPRPAMIYLVKLSLWFQAARAKSESKEVNIDPTDLRLYLASLHTIHGKNIVRLSGGIRAFYRDKWGRLASADSVTTKELLDFTYEWLTARPPMAHRKDKNW